MTRKALFLCFLLLIPACTKTVNLYPVEGPLSLQRPLPILVASAGGVGFGNSGSMWLDAPDGERFRGQWSTASGIAVGFSSATIMSQYMPVYGSGLSVSTGKGQNPGRAFLVGDRGTTIELEFIVGSGTTNGFGFAKDSNGNVYRILF